MLARRGFTLLETLVALAILGTTVVVVLQTFSSATAAAHRSRAYTRGLALAESRMERLLAAEQRDLLTADGVARAFPPPNEEYRYTVIVEPTARPTLMTIGVRVTWEEAGGGQIELVTRTRGGAVP